MFVQRYSIKNATTLKSTSFVAYSVHVVLLISSAVYRQRLVDKGLRVVTVLAVRMETCKESDMSGERRREWAP